MPSSLPELRKFTRSDTPQLAEIYRAAVLTLGPSAYSVEQVKAWATAPVAMSSFADSLATGLTLCAVDRQQPIAFGTLHAGGYIAYLYCDPAHGRRGIASAILSELEREARRVNVATLHTEASCIARGCFERNGFHVVEEEQVEKFGSRFLRYRMSKRLEPGIAQAQPITNP